MKYPALVAILERSISAILDDYENIVDRFLKDKNLSHDKKLLINLTGWQARYNYLKAWSSWLQV
jgi:hypothetical protein